MCVCVCVCVYGEGGLEFAWFINQKKLARDGIVDVKRTLKVAQKRGCLREKLTKQSLGKTNKQRKKY